MDKLKLTGQNLFNSRLGRACIGHAIVHITKQPNLKLKSQPKHLLGSLQLAFALPVASVKSFIVQAIREKSFLCVKFPR
jgi:hypothetical protein